MAAPRVTLHTALLRCITLKTFRVKRSESQMFQVDLHCGIKAIKIVIIMKYMSVGRQIGLKGSSVAL